jgi:hypothetical protein
MNEQTLEAQPQFSNLFRSIVIGAMLGGLGVTSRIVTADSLEIRIWTYATMLLPFAYVIVAGIGASLAESRIISVAQAERIGRTSAQAAQWHDRVLTTFAIIAAFLWFLWIYTYSR